MITCQFSLTEWQVHQIVQITKSLGQVNTTPLTKIDHIAI